MKTDKELIERLREISSENEMIHCIPWPLLKHAMGQAASRLEALSSPMPSREEVARLVDPEAWEEYLLEDGRVDEDVASIFQDAYEASLIKADAILSLFSSSLGRDLFAENAKKSASRSQPSGVGPSDLTDPQSQHSDGERG